VLFSHPLCKIHLCGNLALNESKSLVTVNANVLLVVVGVVSVAAVRVLRVTVALDNAGASGRTGEASGAGSETPSLACSNIVGETIAVVWVAHEYGYLDGLESVAGKSCSCSAADGVVHDLTSLCGVSVLLSLLFGVGAYLRVTDEHYLRAGALLVVGSYSLDNGSSSLGSRLIIGNPSAGRSSTAGWVHNGLGSSTGIGGLD
jgi:hypothetical protein